MSTIDFKISGRPVAKIEASTVSEALSCQGIEVAEGWNLFVNMIPVDSDQPLESGDKLTLKPNVTGNK